MTDVDFGTYHHSTPEQSKQIRESAEKAFSKLLRSLYSSRAALNVLDAGLRIGLSDLRSCEVFSEGDHYRR